MGDAPRPIFPPRPTPWKKFTNRISFRAKMMFGMFVTYCIVHYDLFIEGYKNDRSDSKKKLWIKDVSRDSEIGKYTSIDEEEAPKPITLDPNIVRFREEFAKLRQKLDSDYRHPD